MDKSVLVLSRGFRAGDAITTINLFSKWPKDNLFCASPIDSEYAAPLGGFYLLGDKEITYSFPFNKISRPASSHIGISNIKKKDINSKKSFLTKIYENYCRPILQRLDLYETRLRFDISPEFEAWIRGINPSVIYTSLGDIPIARFVLKLHNKFPDIKIIIHGFDDWLIPTYPIIGSESHRKKADRLLKELLAIASGRFTSSVKMAEEYEKRFGYKFTTFTNPANLISNSDPITKSLIPNIVFTGKVGWHNDAAIRRMVKAVETLNSNGKIVEFDIYTDTPKDELSKFLGYLPDYVHIHPPIPNSEIPDILASAHVLYLPISINNQTARFTRYSMSTKMGEYLWSGTPIIYVGPKDIAMTDFLEEKMCAEVITEDNKELIIKSLMRALKSPDKNKLQKGKEIASMSFNKEIVSESFAKAIEDICRTIY